jgi:hypothetical protein
VRPVVVRSGQAWRGAAGKASPIQDGLDWTGTNWCQGKTGEARPVEDRRVAVGRGPAWPARLVKVGRGNARPVAAGESGRVKFGRGEARRGKDCGHGMASPGESGFGAAGLARRGLVSPGQVRLG